MVRTKRFLLSALILTFMLGVVYSNTRTVSFRNFNSFLDVAPGVDFFAANRQLVTPYEEAVNEAIARLKYLLGDDLPMGAVFICSSLAQRDSLYEPVVMRQGYSWVLITETPEVQMGRQMESIRSQIGDNLPEEIRQRMSNMSFELPPDAMMNNRQATSAMARNIAFAILQVVTNSENFNFRASRVEDVGKSTLQDWLDIGIGAYVSGDRSAVRYLQENLDMAFPTEDVLFMSRPFVPQAEQRLGGGGFGGGQGMAQMLQQMGDNPEFLQMMQQMGGAKPKGEGGGQAKPRGDGGRGGQGGQGGGSPKGKPEGGSAPQLSKDEQDQLLFDGQSITFFDYFLENFGIEKMRELIEHTKEGNESWNFLVQPDIMGRDFSKIESDMNEWIMKQEVEVITFPASKSKPKSKGNF